MSSADVPAHKQFGLGLMFNYQRSPFSVYTVNGNVSYDGSVKDRGRDRLTTHNGLSAMPGPERANITLSARTYNGSIRSTFPLSADNSSSERRKRVSLTLGNGNAHVELEPFAGTIALRLPGEARP